MNPPFFTPGSTITQAARFKTFGETVLLSIIAFRTEAAFRNVSSSFALSALKAGVINSSATIKADRSRLVFTNIGFLNTALTSVFNCEAARSQLHATVYSEIAEHLVTDTIASGMKVDSSGETGLALLTVCFL
jgi:hypothetical protein